MDFLHEIKAILRDVETFAQRAGTITLRRYQKEVAKAIVESVLGGKGMSFVVMFPRQSGKNELQAQLECYLMLMFSER